MGYNSSMDWIVYILELSDGSYYTGITNDMERRLEAHRSGKGSVYVKSRLPIRAVAYMEYVPNRSVASKREREIKSLRRDAKIRLVRGYRESNRKQKE